ncbi:MAG: relaxase/mobilization nuclease domain-containing protein [Clostridia bacterium]|nr:relaxase/mobilization nuclease domain-containing protein [Clostridia bacterium]
MVNSVAFRTGRKYENHTRDHQRLREVSDELCRAHGLSVIGYHKRMRFVRRY